MAIDFNGTAGDTLQTYNSGFSLANSTTGSMAITAAGRLRRNSTSNYNYTYSTQTPSSADYWVEADFFFETTTRTERFGITGRNSTSALTFYLARVATNASSTANVQLWKWVAGTATQLGSSYAITISGDPTFKIRLDMSGSTIRVLVDGVERISVTDTSITAAGRIGFYGSPDTDTFGDTTGFHLDNYDASFFTTAANASGLPATVTLTAPTGTASVSGGAVNASGSPSTVTITAPTGSASGGLPLTLLSDFQGANCSAASTVITNAESTTPTVDLVMRNPEGGTALWQHFLFGLSGCAGKTITVNVDLTNKEGGTTILSTWSGPYRSTTMDDWQAWTAMSRSASLGVLTFTVTGGADDTIYISSMPPNTRGQMESWMSYLESTYPSYIHDDLPSRVAQAGDAYVVDIAPTVVDELGRSSSNQPMFGFRVGDDTVETPQQKKRMVLMSSRHPGEHHGFLQLQGYIDRWLTSTDPLVVEARQRVELWVYPQQAVNGIALGYRRHEPRVGFAAGDDINREWKANSLNDIADYWREVFNTDHGVGYDLVEGMVDFHDLSYSTQLITYYYRTETPNLTALRAVIDAKFTGELGLSSSNTDTATDWFVNTKGIGPSFTAEVSDEATSLAGFRDVGGDWAEITAEWYDEGLLGGIAAEASGSPASVVVSAPNGVADNGIVPVNTGGPGWGASLRHIQQDDEQVMKLVMEAFNKLVA